MPATVTVAIPVDSRWGETGQTPETALTIVAPDPNREVRIVMPWIPDEITRAGFGLAWEQLPRPSRRPLTVARGKNLRTWTFSCLLRDPDLAAPITRLLTALENAADNEHPVRAALGARQFGDCLITGLAVRETDWDANSFPLEATVDIELTEESTVPASIGPVPLKIRGKAKGMARDV